MGFLGFGLRKANRTMPMLARQAASIVPLAARAKLRGFAAEQISCHQLATLAEQVQDVTRRAKEIVARRDAGELITRLEPDSWSVAECFDHLAQTTGAFLPAISDAMATASSLSTNRTLRTGILARLFILNLEPPYGLRFKVLPQLKPKRQDFDAAWSSFLETQSQLLEALGSAAGLAIDKVRIESPVYARIRYNVYEAFRMLAAHERRHLWQVKQILESLDRRHRDHGR
jgi:hypothetical protein